LYNIKDIIWYFLIS